MTENEGETSVIAPRDVEEPHFPVSTAKEAVGFRLREAIRRVGGVEKVAELSGVPADTILSYQRGRYEMKLSVSVALAGACGVSLDWLATGADVTIPAVMPHTHVQYSEENSGFEGVTAEVSPATVRVSQVNEQASEMNEARTGMRAPTKIEYDLIAQAIRIVCAVIGQKIAEDPPDQVAERIIKAYEILVGVES